MRGKRDRESSLSHRLAAHLLSVSAIPDAIQCKILKGESKLNKTATKTARSMLVQCLQIARYPLIVWADDRHVLSICAAPTLSASANGSRLFRNPASFGCEICEES